VRVSNPNPNSYVAYGSSRRLTSDAGVTP